MGAPEKVTGRVAIIGAGAAGLAAAYALRDTGATTVIFEQSEIVGGRATTRCLAGCTYDLGANYIKSPDRWTQQLIRRTLPAGGLVDVGAPVWCFDVDGAIRPGNNTDTHKWNYRQGVIELSRKLLAESGAELYLGTGLQHCSPGPSGWRLEDEAGTDWGYWDVVLMTPPAPESAALSSVAARDDVRMQRVVAALEGITFRPILSVALHYPFPLERPYYALINTDRHHPIGWLARESCKPGHVPDNETLLVVQMSPSWSRANADRAVLVNGEQVAQLVATLLEDRRLERPDWVDQRYWTYALPDEKVDRAPLLDVEQEGLFFAGDWLAGQGRVHLALKSGFDAGSRIANHLRLY